MNYFYSFISLQQPYLYIMKFLIFCYPKITLDLKKAVSYLLQLAFKFTNIQIKNV